MAPGSAPSLRRSRHSEGCRQLPHKCTSSEHPGRTASGRQLG
ncbi:hypothetical protein FM104_05390 [Microbacterium esteraromaticum]|uniref:Uncharacterized protein n=1 Tax=Microbacterium esteraromaticum TaxID=57043 RepID=A0A1R4J3R6_9MICO|nr:hypothetical protein FM104_05390 [Microbacterium esteraromaticum]